MHDTDMLARLVAQAEGEGSSLIMIRALVEEASDLGAARALERLGLSDPKAARDVRELRELLRAWRDAKKAVRSAVIGWMVRGCLALVLIGIAVKLGLLGLLGLAKG
jgi:sirohydrochlorin ferrochelatase